NFWADGAGTETPPGHWNSIAQIVGAAQHNTLEQNARLFALLNIAMADAAICAWDAKYTFHFWRPVTAIRSAGGADASWLSYVGIHFRSANEDGLASGLSIGDWTFTHYLQPKGNRSRK